jgi:hypothetical protein
MLLRFTLVSLVLALPVARGLAAENRGVPVNNGDKVTGSLDPAADVDCFLLEMSAGGSMSLSLKASKDSTLLPLVEARRPDGTPISLSSVIKGEGTAKVSLKNFAVSQTGVWALCIKSHEGSSGSYDAVFKTKAPKKVKIAGTQVPASGTAHCFFAGDDGATLTFSLKEVSGTVATITVVDPDGVEVPGSAAFIVRKGTKVSGKNIPLGQGFGNYALRLGGGNAASVVDCQTAVKFAKVAKSTIVLQAEPSLASVAPAAGRDGITVTLTGTNYATGSRVFFGAVEATNVVVTSATSITCVVPGGADSTAGRSVEVLVLGADGQEGSKVPGFAYHGVPVATSVLPAAMAIEGGGVVTISGSHIRTGTTVTIGGVAGTNVEVLPPNALVCTAPARPPGIAGIVLTDEYGRVGPTFSGLSYVTPPTLTSASPATMPSFGGRTLTLSGSGFSTGIRVFFGGIERNPVTVVNASTLTFMAPAGEFGPVTIEVRDALNQNSVRTDLFSYSRSMVDVSASAVPAAPTGTDFFAGSIGLGDLDGDGFADLFIASGYPRGDYYTGYTLASRVLLNDGTGAFTDATATHHATFADPVDYGSFDSVTLGDIDGGGDVEVILTRRNPLSDPNYVFVRNSKYYAYYIYYGGFNADYRTYQATRVLSNDGSGVLTDDTASMVPDSGSGPFFQAGERWQGSHAVGDVDGDGSLDIVVSHPYYTFHADVVAYYSKGTYYLAQTPTAITATRVLLNDGNGSFQPSSKAMPALLSYGGYPYEDFDARAVALGDLDGQNGADMVLLRESPTYMYGYGGVTGSASALRVMINDGSGNFSWHYPAVSVPEGRTTGSPDFWQGMTLALGDLDGDENTDIVVGRYSTYYWYDSTTTSYQLLPAIRIFRNDGNAYFTEDTAGFLPDTSFKTGSATTILSAAGLTLGDIDGDGSLDMLTTGQNVYYVYDPNGTGYGVYGQIPAGYRHATRLLLNDGSGSFTDVTADWFELPTGDDWLSGSCLELGDIDDDGDLDLVLGSETYPDPYYYTPPHNRPLRVLENK